MPSVIKARYMQDFVIEATFDDGTIKAIDFSQWLEGPVFEPLKDRRFFRKFFLDGSTVAWPNGADIAPETLYEAGAFEGGHNKRPQRTRIGARR